jgi:competence protein ComEA
MKRQVQSYISFTRMERIGIVALGIILIMLIAVRATMHLWVKPDDNIVKEKALADAWTAFKNEQQLPNTAFKKDTVIAQPISENIVVNKTTYHPDVTATSGHLFPFNPNTLDSAGFRKLGLQEKTTAILLHWRAKGKVFRRKEELLKVYTMTPDDYQRLEPYILLP